MRVAKIAKQHRRQKDNEVLYGGVMVGGIVLGLLILLAMSFDGISMLEGSEQFCGTVNGIYTCL